MSTEPLLLKVAEAAALLNVGKDTVHRLILGGELPAVRRGRIVRVSRRAIEEFIAKHEGGSKHEGSTAPANVTPIERALDRVG